MYLPFPPWQTTTPLSAGSSPLGELGERILMKQNASTVLPPPLTCTSCFSYCCGQCNLKIWRFVWAYVSEKCSPAWWERHGDRHRLKLSCSKVATQSGQSGFLLSLLSLRLGPQPVACCHPHLEQAFPLQSKLSGNALTDTSRGMPSI